MDLAGLGNSLARGVREPRINERNMKMRANLKTLWLALLVSLAMGAVVTSSAQATAKFTAENYPAVLTGKDDATTMLGFTCHEVTYEATLGSASTSATITPHLPSCTTEAIPSPQIKLNGCHYVLEALTATMGDTHGRLIIVCPPGQKIQIWIGTCSISIFPQTLGGSSGEVTFTNKSPSGTTLKNWVELHLSISDLHYERVDGFACGWIGNETRTDGSLLGGMAIKAYPDQGSQGHPNTPGKTRYIHNGEELNFDVK
jgi:hypothetical protein